MAFGVNIDIRKEMKKNQILDIIRKNPGISRVAIKTQTGLSMDSVLGYIDDLRNDRLVKIVDRPSAGVGRKAQCLAIHEAGCYFLGIKLNADGLAGMVIDFGFQTICKRRITFQTAHKETVLEAMYDCIDALLAELGDRRAYVSGIGIGVPGYVNSEQGISIRYVHIANWEEVPLKSLVEARYGIPTYVEKSIKVTALAEKMKPENQKVRDVLFIVIGKGVGMAGTMDDMFFTGSNNMACEIGHLFVADNGIMCECGKQGCLETVAGSRSILREMETRRSKGGFASLRGMDAPTVEDLVSGAEHGDEDCIDLVRYIAKHVAAATATVATLFSPQKIVFSGAVAVAAVFQEEIETMVRERCYKMLVDGLTMQYGNYDSLFDTKGAALLAFHKKFG